MNIFLIATTVANFILFLYICLTEEKNKIFWTTATLQFIAVIWSFAKVAEIHAQTLELQMIALKVLLSAINFAGPTWYLFCRYLINKNSNKLFYRFIPFCLFEILILFREDLYFGILHNRYNPIGWVFTLNEILVCFYGFKGIYLLTTFSKKCDLIKKKQIRMVQTGFCAPFFLGIFSLLNIVCFDDAIPIHQTSTAGFSLTVFFTTIAILRYRFLNLASMTSTLMVDNLKDPILVFDLEANINYYNESFKHQFGIFSKIDSFVNVLPSVFDGNIEFLNAIYNESYTNYNGLIDFDGKIYHTNITRMFDHNCLIGTLISFTDVTMYKSTIHFLGKVGMKEKDSDITEVSKMIESKYKDITTYKNVTFTPSEIEIIKLIAQGKGDKEIASLLDKSCGTVRNSVSSLLKRTGAENRTKLALYVLNHTEDKID